MLSVGVVMVNRPRKRGAWSTVFEAVRAGGKILSSFEGRYICTRRRRV
jgi:hypothetical protein